MLRLEREANSREENPREASREKSNLEQPNPPPSRFSIIMQIVFEFCLFLSDFPTRQIDFRSQLFW